MIAPITGLGILRVTWDVGMANNRLDNDDTAACCLDFHTKTEIFDLILTLRETDSGLRLKAL